jgi:polyhydroxyalkanoate synthesis regulator protein
MELFSENRERMQSYMKEAMGGMFPFGSLEELGKQNMAIFEQAMKMFAPVAKGENHNAATKEEPAGRDRMKDLQSKLDELQRQINDMAKK